MATIVIDYHGIRSLSHFSVHCHDTRRQDLPLPAIGFDNIVSQGRIRRHYTRSTAKPIRYLNNHRLNDMPIDVEGCSISQEIFAQCVTAPMPRRPTHQLH